MNKIDKSLCLLSIPQSEFNIFTMEPTTETNKPTQTNKINDDLIEQLSKNKGWDTLEKLIPSSNTAKLNYQLSYLDETTNLGTTADQMIRKEKSGSTVLFWAIVFDKHEIVQALIDANADIDLHTIDNLLFALNNYKNIIQQ